MSTNIRRNRIQKSNQVLIALFVLICAPVSSEQDVFLGRQVLTENWSTKNVFIQPESAVYDDSSDQIFVSNVNGYAKDGNGFISSVSNLDQSVNLKWLDGLDSPTGLTVANGKLYAVDYDQLLVIDIRSRKIIERISSPHEKPALNDVVVSKQHGVFVTGSSSAAIYTLDDGKLKVWKQDPQLLKHANGLFIDGDTLFFGGLNWLMFDLRSGEEVTSGAGSNEKLNKIDGIAGDGCGGFIISMLEDQRLWRISSSGVAAPLAGDLIDGIDLHYANNKLYVPRVGGVLSSYSLSLKDC